MTKKYKSEYYNSGGVYKTRESPGNKKTKACQLWENIRNRCEYLPVKDEIRFGKYSDVDSCSEWKDFQNFAEWFNQVNLSGYFHEGWQLDKDLLIKGNKIYSPESCVFLPEGINKALQTKSRVRGELPIGLSYAKKKKQNIVVAFVCKEPEYTVRAYLPSSMIEEGFYIYKKAREKYIKHLADIYRDMLDPRAYEALMGYEVSMDD